MPSALGRGAGGDVVLLHGVTGSGKTLVYIELLRRRRAGARAERRSCSCPRSRSRRRRSTAFAPCSATRSPCCTPRSGDGERYDAWLALRRGEKRIAVGARSAIFAPLADLGAIVVDEEHEASYKQGETPRYHAREVAIVRARAEGAVVVLGSATPSLESWDERGAGEVRRCSRCPSASAARGCRRSTSSICATAEARAEREAATVDACHSRYVISEPLEDALRERLAARRAEHPAAQPPRLRVVRAVRRVRRRARPVRTAASALTYHRTPERLVCHYCQHAGAAARDRAARAAAQRCGSAGSARSRSSGCSPSAFRTRASRAWTSTRRAGSGRTRRSSIASARRGRHPARHADDREGARLPERDAGGRDRRRRRDQPPGLSRIGADAFSC